MRVETRSIGPIARQVLQQGSVANVVASFEQSFYLETDSYMMCVASDCLYEGPINILIRASGQCPTWSGFAVTVGYRWALGNQSLSSIDGPKIGIDLSAAPTWRPKPPPKSSHNRGQITLAIGELRKFAASRNRPDGLLNLVLDQRGIPSSATGRAAMVPIQALSQQIPAWLSDGDLRLLASLDDLLGLGPGLTPSGDDLIAGLLIACHYVGQGQGASELWRQLRNRARIRTTPISFAHLSAAGQGLGAAPFHTLLDALVQNQIDKLTEALDAVARIGHCSGLDAVGGLLLLFDAWIAAGDGQTVSAA